MLPVASERNYTNNQINPYLDFIKKLFPNKQSMKLEKVRKGKVMNKPVKM